MTGPILSLLELQQISWNEDALEKFVFSALRREATFPLLTYLPLLVGRLFQRCHSSRPSEVLRCGDSMIKLHRISQIPSNCMKRQLSVRATVPKMLISFFLSHKKILFCTDKTESTEWQDLGPRQRICDCAVIHNPRSGLSDQLLSSHQTFCSW